MKKSILFICVHNSARSQIAEGLVNALYADRWEAASGGTLATRIHLGAIKAMAEIGIDISGHRSKSIDEFEGRRFDYVVMVCDEKQADCPFFPGGKEYIHQAFNDPAACTGTEEEILACFRRPGSVLPSGNRKWDNAIHDHLPPHEENQHLHDGKSQARIRPRLRSDALDQHWTQVCFAA